MRSYASGLENMLFLCRDFVLRRNIRIATRSEANRQLRPFAASTFGSHHVGLVDYVNHFWNSLVESKRGIPVGKSYVLAPVLQDVPSNETFGLVNSASAATFGGLFDIKEEEEDTLDVMALHDEVEFSEDEIIEAMKINPELRHRPLTHTTNRAIGTSSTDSEASTSTSTAGNHGTCVPMASTAAEPTSPADHPEVLDLTVESTASDLSPAATESSSLRSAQMRAQLHPPTARRTHTVEPADVVVGAAQRGDPETHRDVIVSQSTMPHIDSFTH